MVVLVPARTFRYVLPLAPFVVFYFFAASKCSARRSRERREWRFGGAFRIAAACILAVFLRGTHRSTSVHEITGRRQPGCGSTRK